MSGNYQPSEEVIAFREEWIAALRSGKFRKGRGQLHYNSKRNTYCCLGVACAMAAKRNKHIVVEERIGFRRRNIICYDGCDGMLPSSVSKMLGIKPDGYSLLAGISLVELNDSNAHIMGKHLRSQDVAPLKYYRQRGMSHRDIATALESGAFWLENQ